MADVVERTDVTAREHGRVVFLRGAVTGQGGTFVVGIDGTGERQLVPTATIWQAATGAITATTAAAAAS
ncbi:MAG: hypothetical protein Q8S73_42835 [Deltaproteobacteria bacterium]|nr:hypothetical protein [Deltaproteobacteria bacterium]